MAGEHAHGWLYDSSLTALACTRRFIRASSSVNDLQGRVAPSQRADPSLPAYELDKSTDSAICNARVEGSLARSRFNASISSNRRCSL